MPSIAVESPRWRHVYPRNYHGHEPHAIAADSYRAHGVNTEMSSCFAKSDKIIASNRATELPEWWFLSWDRSPGS